MTNYIISVTGAAMVAAVGFVLIALLGPQTEGVSGQGLHLPIAGKPYQRTIPQSNVSYPNGQPCEGAYRCPAGHSCLSENRQCLPPQSVRCEDDEHVCSLPDSACPDPDALIYTSTCYPAGYPMPCPLLSDTYCARDEQCTVRRTDSRLVCEQLHEIASPTRHVYDGLSFADVESIPSDMDDAIDSWSGIYHYEKTVRIRPVCEGMIIVRRFVYNIPRRGTYSFNVSAPGCSQAAMQIQYFDNNNASSMADEVTCPQSGIGYKLRTSPILISVGAVDGFRCLNQSELSLTIAFERSRAVDPAHVYPLYALIPLALVCLMVAIIVYKHRAFGLGFLFLVSVFNVTGNIVYLIVVEFERDLYFDLMIGFFLAPLALFVLLQWSKSVGMICRYCWHQAVNPTSVLSLSFGTNNPILTWLIRAIAYALHLGRVVFVFTLATCGLISLVYLKWFALRTPKPDPAMDVAMLVHGVRSRVPEFDEGISSAVPFINLTVILIALFQAIPHLCIVLVNGIESGSTSEPIFIMAIMGSVLVIFHALMYFLYGSKTLIQCLRLGWHETLGHDPYHLMEDDELEEHRAISFRRTSHLSSSAATRVQSVIAPIQMELQMAKMSRPVSQSSTGSNLSDLHEPDYLDTRRFTVIDGGMLSASTFPNIPVNNEAHQQQSGSA